MPLFTQIERDGNMLELRWGEFHVACMKLAAWFDNKSDEEMKKVITGDENDPNEYPETPLGLGSLDILSVVGYGVLSETELASKGVQVLNKVHRFVDVEDNEVFELLPGDTLKMWRQ